MDRLGRRRVLRGSHPDFVADFLFAPAQRAESVLRESEERFRAIFQQAGVGVAKVSLEGKVELANDKYCEVLGYTREDLLEKGTLEITYIGDLNQEITMRRQLLSGEIQSFSTEKRYTRKDGTIVWAKICKSLARDVNGRPKSLIAVVEDISDRKQAEAALKESEERFRNMADTAPVMIWVAGPDKLFTFFNKTWLDFTGRTGEETLRDGWLAGLHTDDRDRFLGGYSSAIDARQEFRSVFRLRRSDGEYRWVLCTGVPRMGPGGIFSGYIGSCVEITDQKLIEEELRASEVRLMAAQRLAKVGSWEREIDGEAIHWSEEMLRIIGLPADKAPSNLATFLSYVHPKDREKVFEIDVKISSCIAPVDTEYRIVRPNGEVCFVRSIVEAIRDDQGAPLRIAEAIQDITEQVTARELLRDSEEHLKNAERLAHVGHWQWDIRGNRISGSEEMYRIFGKPPDYIPSYEGFLEDLKPPDREEMERLIRDSLARKVGHSIEYQVALPNGDVRTISCVWEVLQNEEGLPARIFGTCQDITDSRRAQEESFARQKLESVGTLASGIAHDFNNLLGGVLAQAELALTECAARRFPEEELNSIQNVAIRGSEIVRQLMIYAGKETAVVGLVDVSRIVTEMFELLKVSLSKRAVLETDLARNLPAILANAAQVSQIVLNLVTNASDAIGERDGVIRVTTRCVKVAQDSPEGGLTDCDQVQLEVSDTGHGLPPEPKPRCSTRFHHEIRGPRPRARRRLRHRSRPRRDDPYCQRARQGRHVSSLATQCQDYGRRNQRSDARCRGDRKFISRRHSSGRGR